MNDYTPTTEQIRAVYASGEFADRQIGPGDYAYEHGDFSEFDRWLAEVERAAAEKAWDDGRAEGFHRSGRTNPYRKETR